MTHIMVNRLVLVDLLPARSVKQRKVDPVN